MARADVWETMIYVPEEAAQFRWPSGELGAVLLVALLPHVNSLAWRRPRPPPPSLLLRLCLSLAAAAANLIAAHRLFSGAQGGNSIGSGHFWGRFLGHYIPVRFSGRYLPY